MRKEIVYIQTWKKVDNSWNMSLTKRFLVNKWDVTKILQHFIIIFSIGTDVRGSAKLAKEETELETILS